MKNIMLSALLLLPALALAQGQFTDWNLVRTGTSSTSTTSQMLARSAVLGWTNSTSFTLLTATRDVNQAVTTGTVQWPDGSTGVFTTDVASTVCPGAVDAYHVTYVPVSGPTLTVTQAAVTRNPSCAVVAQPVPTVA